MQRGRRRSRSRSRSPVARSSRWQGRSSRSRSRSPARRGSSAPRDERKPRTLPTRGDQRNQDKKTRDFSHLVQWGKKEDEDDEDKEPEEPPEKPNFGLSGALAKDQATGNVQNGVVMKWSEPPEARRPTKRYRFYVFKNDAVIETLHVHRKSAFLIGRDKAAADVLTEHQSCSKQHAVLQYRLYQKETEDGLGFEQEVRPYILDLNSTNSTFLNGRKIDSSRYIELKEKDVLKFGESTREYVLMDATYADAR